MVKCGFLAPGTFEINVKASVTTKVLGRISFHVTAENWKHLKDTLAFCHFFAC